MEINNFYQLENLLEFKEGSYYKFIALIRAKDNSGVIDTKELGEIFVRQWFVDSQTSLLKYREDMISLCKATGARLYVTTDRKSVKKTVFKMLEQLHDIIKQFVFGSYTNVSLRKLSKFSSSASSLAECSDGNKYWLIDIDNDRLKPSEFEELFHTLFTYIPKFFTKSKVYFLNTLNGVHILIQRNCDAPNLLNNLKQGVLWINDPSLITKQKIKEVLNKYPDNISLKENALTLVYFNKGE